MMTTTGTWHKSESGSQFQQFRTNHCKHCPVLEKCTSSKRNGKIIQRREYAQSIENNKVRIESDKETYKRRQAIVEHPYGTIKRQWGYSYIMTKQFMHRASSDVGFIMTAYNLRRIINILGKDVFRQYLENMRTRFLHIFIRFRLMSSPPLGGPVGQIWLNFVKSMKFEFSGNKTNLKIVHSKMGLKINPARYENLKIA
jgi:hypothetical protein